MACFFIVAICALKLCFEDTACAARRSSPAAVVMRSCVARARARRIGSLVSHSSRIFLERSMEPSTPPEAHVCGCHSVVPQNLDKGAGAERERARGGTRRWEDGCVAHQLVSQASMFSLAAVEARVHAACLE